MNMGKKNGIPDRWESYSNMGRHIPGTRFISFKVPLDKKYESKGGNFSLRDLTDHCPRLGIVIDLTNTNRYYNPEELTDLNIGYRKIYTEGHVLPSKGVVWEFMDAVTTFLEANEHNDKLVGVHCTHGVNRTGYLVCRYMIQLLDFAPDQAIADFDSARGHAQERRLYTDDLRLASWINEDPFDYKKTSVGGRHNNSGGWENRQGRAPHPAYHNTNNSYGDGSRRGGGRGGGGDTSSAAFESPVSNGDASVGGCRRRGDREYLKARRSQDSSSSWRVTPIAAATGTLDDAVKENVKDTPRGTKRGGLRPTYNKQPAGSPNNAAKQQSQVQVQKVECADSTAQCDKTAVLSKINNRDLQSNFKSDNEGSSEIKAKACSGRGPAVHPKITQLPDTQSWRSQRSRGRGRKPKPSALPPTRADSAETATPRAKTASTSHDGPRTTEELKLRQVKPGTKAYVPPHRRNNN